MTKWTLLKRAFTRDSLVESRLNYEFFDSLVLTEKVTHNIIEKSSNLELLL